ncbi:MAG: dienelactone hydrolase family protein [Chloroflexi bacterium]|nr:dienelactone hydrolase family protein [Chloroflexota bacterium]
MVIDWIRYPGKARDYRGYVVRPKVAYTSPALLILPDRWGLSPWIKHLAERLVHEGYVVMVPDVYDGQVPREGGEARYLMEHLVEGDGRDRVVTALHWLRNQGYTRAHRTAVIGFEGLAALTPAVASAQRFPPAAVVLFYPFLQPILSQLDAWRVPVQAHFGEQDDQVPLSEVETFVRALEQAGVPHEVHIYPEARHDFFCPEAPSFFPDAAEQAWQRMLRFLDEVVRGGQDAA